MPWLSRATAMRPGAPYVAEARAKFKKPAANNQGIWLSRLRGVAQLRTRKKPRHLESTAIFADDRGTGASQPPRQVGSPMQALLAQALERAPWIRASVSISSPLC